MDIEKSNLCSGSILISRGSIRETLNHSLNMAVRNALFNIEERIGEWKYVGWLECKTNPTTGKRKHPETEFFIYYQMNINGKIYYANVKAHKHYTREELYCIRDHLDLSRVHRGTPPKIDAYKKK